MTHLQTKKELINSDVFIKTLMKNITKNSSVFDLGAGNGFIAEIIASIGAQVICLDIQKKPCNLKSDILWICEDFRNLNKNWIGRIDAEVLICRNIFHFYTHDWVSKFLIPKIVSAMPNLKSIMFQAFRSSPMPIFNTEYASYWTSAELVRLVPNFNAKFTSEIEYIGPDIDGVIRNFYLSIALLTIK